ncbi:MAG: hypothetical protein R3C26_18125 [Calditrichia bacterium]
MNVFGVLPGLFSMLEINARSVYTLEYSHRFAVAFCQQPEMKIALGCGVQQQLAIVDNSG